MQSGAFCVFSLVTKAWWLHVISDWLDKNDKNACAYKLSSCSHEVITAQHSNQKHSHR